MVSQTLDISPSVQHYIRHHVEADQSHSSPAHCLLALDIMSRLVYSTRIIQYKTVAHDLLPSRSHMTSCYKWAKCQFIAPSELPAKVFTLDTSSNKTSCHTRHHENWCQVRSRFKVTCLKAIQSPHTRMSHSTSCRTRNFSFYVKCDPWFTKFAICNIPYLTSYCEASHPTRSSPPLWWPNDNFPINNKSYLTNGTLP